MKFAEANLKQRQPGNGHCWLACQTKCHACVKIGLTCVIHVQYTPHTQYTCTHIILQFKFAPLFSHIACADIKMLISIECHPEEVERARAHSTDALIIWCRALIFSLCGPRQMFICIMEFSRPQLCSQFEYQRLKIIENHSLPQSKTLFDAGINWQNCCYRCVFFSSSFCRVRSNSNILTRRLCRNRSYDDNELYRSNSFKFERFRRDDTNESNINTLPKQVWSSTHIIWM